MKHPLVLSLMALCLGLMTAGAAEKIYTPPVIPEGVNPATYPLPRDDWYYRVQNNFNKTQGKQFDLIFDGDSITDGWQSRGKAVWDKYYGSLNAVDFGIGGDKTEHVLWRLSKGQVDGMNPKLIVLMIGTNNTGRDSADQIVEGVKAIVADYLKRCPKSHMLLLAVFPRNEKANDPTRLKIKDINSKISALASDRVTYLDIGEKFLTADGTLPKEIMPDLLHPNEKGYEIWAEAIQPVIAKYFPAPAKQ